jgi:DNA-binding transcriptional MocR family regulator
MNLINLNRDGADPLVDQIVDDIRQQIDARALRPGSKLPSIRTFAHDHGISRFTVVEAYDRLVAMGYLRSRRGAGFFATSTHDKGPVPKRDHLHNGNDEMVWLIRRLLEAKDHTTLVGGPWLPNSWLHEASLRRTIRMLAGRPGSHITDYGDAYGHLALREQVAGVLLPDIGINANVDQVLLTTGASQALDLVIRRLLGPGDTVLVDDPGYYNLFGSLRLQGLQLIGVPRGRDGPDVDALDALAGEHRPKLYFTQSVLQNPTGTNMTPHVSYRVLQTAARYNFDVVEDDIFSDFETQNVPRLAALDQLARVIYIRSFSKTLSGSLRVGFIAGSPTIVHELADIKMVTGITSSLLSEALIHQLLADGHYRKFVARLRQRVADARRNVIKAFEDIGIETFPSSESAMFLWGRFAGVEDSLPLAKHALSKGVLLAPGTVFRPNLQPSPWLRFNVAVCDDLTVQRRLSDLAKRNR